MSSDQVVHGYIAFEGFEKELQEELGSRVRQTVGRLFLADASELEPAWSQVTWLQPEEIEITSINDAARKLRERAPLWVPFSQTHHRRAHLIQENLPKVKNPVLNFLDPIKKRPLAAWTILEPNRILASSTTTSFLPLGENHFNEDKTNPPSRAYLKLWELFTVYGFHPQKNSRVVDAGSSPGGWTWVLAELGCQVISVDKAPLDEKVARYKNVQSLKKDAFELKPEDIGKVDWFFSDIICEPKRIEELIQKWLSSGLCRNFVCTVKFKGETDHATTQRLGSIPGSRVKHLFHNKHELTWWLVRDSFE